MLKNITLKDLRPRLPQVIEDVEENLDRYIISKRGEPVAVILSMEDYESILETLNETQDQENMKRIRKGLQEAKQGKTISWKALKKKHRLE